MSKINYNELHALLSFSADNSPGRNEELRKKVEKTLTDLYGEPLPGPVFERMEEELITAERYGFSAVFLAHADVVNCLDKFDDPYYILGSNGASIICFALGITRINPLPPHYRCPKCRNTEFVNPGEYETGILLPRKTCPVCGEDYEGDGYMLRLESYLGYRSNKTPNLMIGIPTQRFEDAVQFIKRVFDAEVTDYKDLTFSEQTGRVQVLVDLLPVEKLYSDDRPLSFIDMNDKKILDVLSSPDSLRHYIAAEDTLRLLKILLRLVEIDHYSDLFIICGLINSPEWLEYVIPQIQDGTRHFRKVISSREDIYRYLIKKGVDAETSFKIMEMTRKGRAAVILDEPEIKNCLSEHGVPEEYLDDLRKIRYLMTKAQTMELARSAYKSARDSVYR